MKSKDITLLTKARIVKAMVFLAVIYRCESWTIKKAEHQKNQCFQTVVLETTLESLLDCREFKPVHPKGNQPWICIKRTDAEAPTLRPSDVKSWLWKRPWCWERLKAEEKGTAEDEMGGWNHWLNGHRFEHTLGDSGGQGGLAYCNLWGRTVRYDWVNNNIIVDLQCFRYAGRWLIYTYTHILFLRLFSIIGYYKILSIVPCAIQ